MTTLMVHPRMVRPSPTVRDVLAVLFRQKRFLITLFLFLFVAVFSWTVLHPKYQAEMEVLVHKDRVNPVVGPADLQVPLLRTDVTEEELNSEAELLRGRDLLENVVRTSALARQDDAAATEKAVRELQRLLRVETVRRTNLIKVTYNDRTRATAEQVLSSLATLYLAKHTEVHHSSGSLAFFQQQAQRYAESLQNAESRLLHFSRETGVVSATTERDLALQKLTEFENSERQIQIGIREAEQKLRSLRAQAEVTPERETTQVKVADNPFLLQQLKSTLNQLSLKHTELLTKFQPTYRLVQEVDKQIEDTQAAITREEGRPVREEVTDKEPNHAWAKSELLRVEVDLQTLRARSAGNAIAIRQYRAAAQRMGEAAVHQEDLQRMARIAEENYVLYQRKREETRIAEALDEKGILNVTLAEPPTVPRTPLWSMPMCGLIAFLVSGGGSLVTAAIRDHLSPAFRTPTEVMSELGAPVLASLPRGSWPEDQV